MANEDQDLAYEEESGQREKISIDEAMEFLREKAGAPCPFCGGKRWNSLLGEEGEENLVTGLVIDTSANHKKHTLYPRSVILIECNECGFVRPHAAKAFRKWKDGKARKA